MKYMETTKSEEKLPEINKFPLNYFTDPKQVSSLTNTPTLDATTVSFTARWTMENNTNYDSFIIDITPKPDGDVYPK